MPKRTPSPVQGQFPESDPRRNSLAWKASGTIVEQALARIRTTPVARKLRWQDLDVNESLRRSLNEVIGRRFNGARISPDDYESAHRVRFGRSAIRGS